MSTEKALHPVFLDDVAKADGLAEGVFFFVGSEDHYPQDLYQKQANGKYIAYRVKDPVASVQKPLPDSENEFVIAIPRPENLAQFLQTNLVILPPAAQLFILEKIFRLAHMLRLEDKKKAEYVRVLESKYVQILRKHKNDPHVRLLVEASTLILKSSAVREIYRDNLGVLVKFGFVTINPINKGMVVVETNNLYGEDDWSYEPKKNIEEEIMESIKTYPQYAQMFLDPASEKHYKPFLRNPTVLSRLITEGSSGVHKEIRKLGLLDEFNVFRRWRLYSQLEKAEEKASDEYIVQRYEIALDASQDPKKRGFFANRRLARYKAAAERVREAQKNKSAAKPTEENKDPIQKDHIQLELNDINDLEAELAKYSNHTKFEIFTPDLIVVLNLTPGQEKYDSFYDQEVSLLPDHSPFLSDQFKRIPPRGRHAHGMFKKEFRAAYEARKVPAFETPERSDVYAYDPTEQKPISIELAHEEAGLRIIPSAPATWVDFWRAYEEYKDYVTAFQTVKIDVDEKAILSIANVAEKADVGDFKAEFMRRVALLKPHQIRSLTSAETESADTQSSPARRSKVASHSTSSGSEEDFTTGSENEGLSKGWTAITSKLRSRSPSPVKVANSAIDSDEDKIKEIVDVVMTESYWNAKRFLTLFDKASDEILTTIAQQKLLDATKVPERIGTLIQLDSTITLDQLRRMRELKIFSPAGLVDDWLAERIEEREIEELVKAISNPHIFLNIFDTVSDDTLRAISQGMLLTAKKQLPHADKFIRSYPRITLEQLKRMQAFNIFAPSALMEQLVQERIDKLAAPQAGSALAQLGMMPAATVQNANAKIFDLKDPAMVILFNTLKALYLHAHNLVLQGKYNEAREEVAALCRRINQMNPDEGAEIILDGLKEILSNIKLDASHQFMAYLLYHLASDSDPRKASVTSLAAAIQSLNIQGELKNKDEKDIAKLMALELSFVEKPINKDMKPQAIEWQQLYIRIIERLSHDKEGHYYNAVIKLIMNSQLLEFGEEGKKAIIEIFKDDPIVQLAFRMKYEPNVPLGEKISGITLADLVTFMIANPQYARALLKCKKPDVCAQLRENYKHEPTPDTSFVAQLTRKSNPQLREAIRDFALLGKTKAEKEMFKKVLTRKLDEEINHLISKNDVNLTAVKLDDESLNDELERDENKAIRKKLADKFPGVLQDSRTIVVDSKTGKKLSAK